MDDEKQPFIPFIKELFESRNFNWHVTLKFAPERFRPPSKEQLKWEEIWDETDPDREEGWVPTPRTAQECFEQWLRCMRGPSPVGYGVEGCIWLQEVQEGGKISFHVLIADWEADWGSDSHQSRELWHDISGGWSSTRTVDERLIGLFGHLVMREHCSLTVHCGQSERRYSNEDFIPWRPKS
jgi:hypothetical protein